MIRISQIDDKFSIYKDNTVVLLGIGHGTKEIVDLMRYHEIDIKYICDNNKDNWGKIIEGIPIISPPHLQQIAQKENIVVQIAISNTNGNIEQQLSSIGIVNIVSFEECRVILKLKIKIKLSQNNKLYQNDLKEIENFRIIDDRLKLRKFAVNSLEHNNIILLCSPQKTGNTTIIKTFRNYNIPIFKLEHEPSIFDKKLFLNLNNNIKIIVGLRDFIAQRISSFYQMFPIIYDYESTFGLSLIENNINMLKDGGDVQRMFDLEYQNYISTFDIIRFLNQFKENILDLSAYPFDQEKGYTIIKEGNVEVFVYQLERMNDAVKEMSDWIGQTPFDNWVRDNEASSKWIANSYKQAQKEITFSQEYFDRCYNDPWIQHFYSQEDIAKFKERWRPHIKE